MLRAGFVLPLFVGVLVRVCLKSAILPAGGFAVTPITPRGWNFCYALCASRQVSHMGGIQWQ